jgi:hypothetical protein
MGTRWTTIGLPALEGAHRRIDAQTGSGPLTVYVAVDGVFVIGIGMVVEIEIGGVGVEEG